MSEFWGEHFWIVSLKTIAGQDEEGEGEKKIYPENKCELSFKQQVKFAEGVNLLLLQQRRDLEVGHYDVKCTIGDKIISAENAMGIFEHVYIRY